MAREELSAGALQNKGTLQEEDAQKKLKAQNKHVETRLWTGGKRGKQAPQSDLEAYQIEETP